MSNGVWRWLAIALLPTRCAGCQQVGPEVICRGCLAGIAAVGAGRCVRCGRHRETTFASPDCGECYNERIGVAKARSLLVYNEAVRVLLAEFKYRRHLGVGKELAARLLQWIDEGWPSVFDEPDAAFDLVVPVPLHRKRLRQRGFNQSALIARMVAQRASLRYSPEVLIRWRPTPTQVGLTASQRMKNVRGAFRVPEARRGALAGKRVLLIDDLMTTGATLASCANTLKRAGSGLVYGLTICSSHRKVQPVSVSVPVG
ncbi:ComF family protein [bacterium]|nr:ComF family protein [bacterium]